MVDLLGMAVFATVVGIGLLDLKSGLSPFATYRSTGVVGIDRRTPTIGPRGDDNQPRPPAPAQ